MMRLRIVLAVVLSAVSVLGVLAGRTRTITGEYTYALPVDMSQDDGKQVALERAIITALADEFGTVVSQDNTTRVENVNGESQTDFYSVGRSMVKGEWIETIGEPKFDIQVGDHGVIFITCKVKGKARSRESADVSFSTVLLRNGLTDRYASSEFKSGDKLYLQFTAPTDGYIAVYLADAGGNAFTMLPYKSSNTGAFAVKANEQYLFFSADAVPYEQRGEVDEYHLETNSKVEYNTLYVVFSEKEFVKAVDNSGGTSLVSGLDLPRWQSFDDFQKWLSKQRAFDDKMQVETLTIRIIR